MADLTLNSADFGAAVKANGNFLPIAATAGTTNRIAYVPPAQSQRVIIPSVKAAGTSIRPAGVTSRGAVIGRPQSPLSPTALELQARLRARWPAVMARARELEKTIPDPVQAIIDLLGNLPGDYATWREILDEPYG